MSPSERIHNPTSSAELDRRWAAVRSVMADRGIHVLIMQANNDFMGGYVKWFTDTPATNGYPVTVAFPADAAMTFIGQGPFGMDRQVSDEPAFRGIGRVLGAPSYVTAGYTLEYDAGLLKKALAQYIGATIGMVGLGTLPHALIKSLMDGEHSTSTFVDASSLVDEIKAIKSAEELASIRKTAAMQDACMEQVFAAIQPGMRDIEIAAVAEQYGRSLGSEQGLFLCASGPVGEPARFGNRRMQNRTIRQGDAFSILIESGGPGGLYTELGRTCVLGQASDEMIEEMGFVHRAQEFATSLLVPGADCGDIWKTYNDFMVENGRPPEQRLYCHGMGYDMVERPLVRFDEPMKIAANMNISCHPTYATDSAFNWLCDNFIVTDAGAEKIHKSPWGIRAL